MKTYMLMTAAAAALALAGCGGKSEAPAADAAAASATDTATSAATTIAANIAASPTHKTLASALQAAGLTETLNAAEPFTLFAPTDAAFAQVSPETRDGWMLPARKDVLAAILKYHVIPGKLTAADIAAKIAEGGGKAVLRTIDGQDLTATKSGDEILLTTTSGNKAIVTQADVDQSNGVVHIVDAVLVPKI